MLEINSNPAKKLFIVDNFYADPHSVRKFALGADYAADIRFYKGLRSTKAYHPEGIVQTFENIIGEKITNFSPDSPNGCFQITTSKDPQVYHHDLQRWAAMIYLTPGAPLESGTRTHRSNVSGATRANDPGVDQAFAGGFLDATKFDTVDSAGNVYNRLVIMDAMCIHSAGTYFGQNNNDGRLVHLFFFD
jgi:hypothetical protein